MAMITLINDNNNNTNNYKINKNNNNTIILICNIIIIDIIGILFSLELSNCSNNRVRVSRNVTW